ncbi:cytochrome C and Quinol oxidase polypeptide I family protein [Wolbachia endosymbiont of Wuchereria bancrofti]|nr:cytochrome C and Quinol oxidase polypeptide I family protein [Wolbachia endosymbiont of Wuchereria bancrofti]
MCFNIRTFINDKGNYLLHSFLLFTYGGVLGILTIEGNVTIHAHYHGSVAGITIAFINSVYWLLPKLGCKKIKSP